MELISWLSDINEQYLTGWANKGLVRRGKKQLEKESISDWQLTAHAASANINNYHQTIDGIGFEFAKCNCAAAGPCFHLTCFLLGLQQKVANRASADPQIAEPTTEPKVKIDDKATRTVAPSPSWQISCAKQRAKLLGQINIKKAALWLQQGVTVYQHVKSNGLLTEIYLEQVITVFIPKTGGVAISSCSCKKERCAHRAVAVLHALPESSKQSVFSQSLVLSDYATQCINALSQWLQSLLLHGRVGTTQFSLEQGQALVTELTQADLPRLAKLLSILCVNLKQDVERMSQSSPSLFSDKLAEIWAIISALSPLSVDLPLPLLTGEHRKRYAIVQDIDVFALGIECWRSLTGHRGFTLHMYCPTLGRFLSFSQSRSRSIDPNWDTIEALKQAKLGGYDLPSLVTTKFRIGKGWVSSDGRVSSQTGTTVLTPSSQYWADFYTLAKTKQQILSGYLEQLKQNPFAQKTQQLVAISTIEPLIFNRFKQTWQGICYDVDDNKIHIEIATTSQADQFVRHINSTNMIRLVYGYWFFNSEQQLTLSPILAWELNSLKPIAKGCA